MSIRRLDRVNELLKREIADSLIRILAESDRNLSAITITGVKTSPDLRNARVMVSIREQDEEVALRTLSFIRRQRNKLQTNLNKHTFIKFTPRLSFHLDKSIAKGNDVLSILSELERENTALQECDDEY